jgi:hypothetical protein
VGWQAKIEISGAFFELETLCYLRAFWPFQLEILLWESQAREMSNIYFLNFLLILMEEEEKTKQETKNEKYRKENRNKIRRKKAVVLYF